MATLLLAAAGSAIGGAIGGTVLGVGAAAIGQAVGASIGGVIDQQLFGSSPGTVRREGPRLQALDVTSSEAGAPLPDIWGRTAVAGEIIWAARLREQVKVETERVGSGKKKGKVETTSYEYFASFAISLGEGPVRGFNRIWADGKPLDISVMRNEGRLRFYPGAQNQNPDFLIAQTEGAAPAFRGTAYIVFQDLPLADFGNRLPQVRVEVVTARGDLEPMVPGVCLIPGSTPWGYDPNGVSKVERSPSGVITSTVPVNANRYTQAADITESLNLLDQTLPNANTVSLVVAWFGDDLRADRCRIVPKVENLGVQTVPEYVAGGLPQSALSEVTKVNGRPAYGSSPADLSVIRGIQYLRARGKRVVLYPFIMMDIPPFERITAPDVSAATGPTGYIQNETASNGHQLRRVYFHFADGDVYILDPSTFGFTLTNFSDENFDGLSQTGRRILFGSESAVDPDTGETVRLNGGPDPGELEFRKKLLGKTPTGPKFDPSRIRNSFEPLVDVYVEISAWPDKFHKARIYSVTDNLDATVEGFGSNPPATSVSWAFFADWTGEMYDSPPPFEGAYPWRGRIAPDPDKDAPPPADQINQFVNGPDGLRRFITHLAGLAAAAGGVDAFLVGTELRGLTMAQTAPGVFPMAGHLASIAADVRAILPGAAISYAADWSEYHSVTDAGGTWFHLDPLWSDPNINFVAIDNYLPLSDWRAGTDHADYSPDGPTSPYDLEYLKSNIEGGEYWDWFYPDKAARDAQARAPITDGNYGEPWVFRQKAWRAWQSNAHHNRPDGTRAATPTAWVPSSKPVWFTELGCPAVTFGANQPNVFVSRLSSESALPHYSDGARDDFMQRQYLRAWFEWLSGNAAPVMSPGDVQVWAWDARPFPEFPTTTGLWADGPDWTLGHWLNGRAGAAPLAEIARGRALRHGLALSDLSLSRAWGQADGYAIPGPTSWRDVLQPFEIALAAALVEDGGRIVVESRAAPLVFGDLTESDLAEVSAPSPWSLTRSALEDSPQVASLLFRDGLGDYETAVARAIISAGREAGIAEAETPLILDYDRGIQAAERMLREAGAGRELLSASLPRSRRDLRPGVVLPLTLAGRRRLFLVERITDGEALKIEARSYDAAAFAGAAGAAQAAGAAPPSFASSSVVLVPLDLPRLLTRPEIAEWEGFLAAHAQPWPGANVLRAASPAPAIPIEARETIGETVGTTAPGRPWTWDTDGAIDVLVYAGAPVSRSRAEILAGHNVAAIDHGGDWEIVQFAGADLVGANTWRLTDLVRGARGTEFLASQPLPEGATVVFLSGATVPAGLAAEDVGRALTLRYGPFDADPVTYTEVDHTFRGVGRRPFAPARLTATATGADWSLSWTRRARTSAGLTLSTGAPLDEAVEEYRVEIGPEGAPARVATVAAPAFTYTAAMQAADGVSAPFDVRVAQVSATWGAGTPAQMTVTP